MNKTEIEAAAKIFFEKLFPKCSIRRPKIRKYGHDSYEIEAEMNPKSGCSSSFNPSRRYNISLRVRAKLIARPSSK